MLPLEQPPGLAVRVGRTLLMLVGAAVIVWVVLRVLASIHSGAGA
jgi:hypothetical protein